MTLRFSKRTGSQTCNRCRNSAVEHGNTMCRKCQIDEATFAAWHEFCYPRPTTNQPTETFKVAIRAALEGEDLGTGELVQRESFKRAVQVAVETIKFRQTAQPR